MSTYLKNQDYDKLDEYLSHYQKSIPDNTPISFCNHNSVNTLLVYFAQQAKENNINFSVKLACDENIIISEIDLSVLLGNLLENALDACLTDTVTNSQNKNIIIRGTIDKLSLCICIDNTFDGQLKKTPNDVYLSTKHKGPGIGIESVKEIANQYNGLVQFSQQDNLFMVSVLLNF